MNSNFAQQAHNSGPSYAFFDVDDTLIAVKSMFSFQDYWFSRYGSEQDRIAFEQDMCTRNLKNACWKDLNRRYYAHFAGRPVDLVNLCAEEWFKQLQQSTKALFHTSVVDELMRHQAKGRAAVFVSGSFNALLAPIAAHLNVKHILAIEMEAVDGIYTGNILPPQTIGEGKAEAMSAFLKKRGVSAQLCYAYGDDISDIPMLKLVAHPTAVRGGRSLETYAKEMGWRLLSPNY